MPKTHPRYPQEFRRQMVELMRVGRTPEALAREFEPSGQTSRNWVQQADLDEGRRHDGLTSDEREEFRRLRREVRQLRQEREILAKAAAWFARETGSVPSGSRVREGGPSHVSNGHDVPGAGCLLQRVLRVAGPSALRAATQSASVAGLGISTEFLTSSRARP